MGVGEASGMFPIDSSLCDYDDNMVSKFDSLLKARGLPYTLRQILPEVRNAGEAGVLTAEGAKLLDPSGICSPASLSALLRETHKQE